MTKSIPYSKEQMEALEKIFQKITTQNNTTVGSLAAKGNHTCMFTANFNNNDV